MHIFVILGGTFTILAGIGAVLWLRSSSSRQKVDQVLQSHGYDLIIRIVSDLETKGESSKVVCSSLVPVLCDQGLQFVFPIIDHITSHELSITNAPEIAFRANGFGQRLLMDTLRYYSSEYLEHSSVAVLQNLIRFSAEELASFEPNQLLGTNDPQQSQSKERLQQKFKDFCEATFSIITDHSPPLAVRYILCTIQKKFRAKWPDSTLNVTSSLLILRLVVPYLVDLPRAPTSAKRLVMRAAQIIQCIFNGVKTKDSTLSYLNDWMVEKQPKTVHFMETASTCEVNLDKIKPDIQKRATDQAYSLVSDFFDANPQYFADSNPLSKK